MNRYIVILTFIFICQLALGKQVICTPTINFIEQKTFSVLIVKQQSDDPSNLEEMLNTVNYGNLEFRMAIDEIDNYRLRINRVKPFDELLISQGRFSRRGNDKVFFVDIFSTTSERIRLDCKK